MSSNTKSGARTPRKPRRGGETALDVDLSEILFHPEFITKIAAQLTPDQVTRLSLDFNMVQVLVATQERLFGEMYRTVREDMRRLVRPRARAAMLKEIARYCGVEVFFIGRLDESGAVDAVEALSWGNGSMAPALAALAKPGDVIIHNHPNMVELIPSVDDVNISSEAAQRGVGSYIVDNAVSALRVVVKPWPAKVVSELAAAPIAASDPSIVRAVAASYGLSPEGLPKNFKVSEDEALWIMSRRRALAAQNEVMKRGAAGGIRK